MASVQGKHGQLRQGIQSFTAFVKSYIINAYDSVYCIACKKSIMEIYDFINNTYEDRVKFHTALERVIQAVKRERSFNGKNGWYCNCGANNLRESFCCQNCGIERKHVYEGVVVRNIDAFLDMINVVIQKCIYRKRKKKRKIQMYCRNCGMKIEHEDAKFCNNCGAKIQKCNVKNDQEAENLGKNSRTKVKKLLIIMSIVFICLGVGYYFFYNDILGLNEEKKYTNYVVEKADEDIKIAGAEAKTAYKKFLERYTFQPLSDEEYYDLTENSIKKYGFHVDYYFVTDISGDGIPELFTYTVVNMRHEVIKVYTYKLGQVEQMEFSNGSTAVFDNAHTANGGFTTYICKAGHIHNSFYGGLEDSEEVFKVQNNQLIGYDSNTQCQLLTDIYQNVIKNTEENRKAM